MKSGSCRRRAIRHCQPTSSSTNACGSGRLELRANFSRVKATELLCFLKEWWTNHIQAEDKSYAPYLGSGEPATAQSNG